MQACEGKEGWVKRDEPSAIITTHTHTHAQRTDHIRSILIDPIILFFLLLPPGRSRMITSPPKLFFSCRGRSGLVGEKPFKCLLREISPSCSLFVGATFCRSPLKLGRVPESIGQVKKVKGGSRRTREGQTHTHTRLPTGRG